MDVNYANTLSLMRHRIKPQNASMGHVFGRLSRAKWSCWLKRVLGDEVDQCLHQAWGSDEEWDGVDDQQGKPHRYCTDHATIELTRLAPCDLRIRISTCICLQIY